MDSCSWIHGYTAKSNGGGNSGFTCGYAARCTHNAQYFMLSMGSIYHHLPRQICRGSCLIKLDAMETHRRTSHLIHFLALIWSYSCIPAAFQCREQEQHELLVSSEIQQHLNQASRMRDHESRQPTINWRLSLRINH
jgi:hypothetical protein